MLKYFDKSLGKFFDIPLGQNWNKIYDGEIDFSDEEQVAEIAKDMPISGVVFYDDPDSPDTPNDNIYINGIYNTKEIITESGEWTAPVTGWYKVTCISGGQGGKIINTTTIFAQGGDSGKIVSDYLFLEKNDSVSVTIGAGGIGKIFQNGDTSLNDFERDCNGGETSFGSITTNISGLNPIFRGISLGSGSTGYAIYSIGCGGGLGGGRYGSGADPNSGAIPAAWYGAGGGSKIAGASLVSPGYQGCIIVEYYDAAKDKNISIDMASSITIKELQEQSAVLSAKVQELENNE